MNTAEYRALAENLDEWISSDLGRWMLAQERPCLRHIARELFGYYLLEVSLLCESVDFMQDSPIASHALLGPCSRGGDSRILCLPDALPVANASVDAVVLPHTLDFAPEPHRVLREVERVLIPEGRVVICGFKPFSLWGAWRMLPGSSKHHPWKAHFISAVRLEDWLSLLGFEVEHIHMMVFRPPWKRMFIRRKLLFWEQLGRRFWSRFAGVYVMVAVKREITLTPIRPRWVLQPRLRNAAAEPMGCSLMKKDRRE